MTCASPRRTARTPFSIREIAEASSDSPCSARTERYWRHRNQGEGPPSFRLGPRRVVYAEDKLLAWVKAQEAAEINRRQGAA